MLYREAISIAIFQAIILLLSKLLVLLTFKLMLVIDKISLTLGQLKRKKILLFYSKIKILMSSKDKIKRYQADQIDFIIPFLVNQSVDRTNKAQLKRTSIPCLPKDPHTHELDKIAKIYNIKPKKSIKKHYFLSKSNSKDQPASPLDKKQSAATQVSDCKSQKYHRFTKVYSQINHAPTDLSPSKDISHRDFSNKSRRTKAEDTPILGIRFKKSKDFIHSNSQLFESPQQEETSWEGFRGDIKKKVNYLRREKEWGKIRGMNVDLIVNRRCTNFHQLITEYVKRMEIEEGSRIFIFDSKDLWMKRVLLQRGWVENSNLSSRAFNLYWGNKLYKGPLYESQQANHYPNSYSLTTKAGLYNLLKKFNLKNLQPTTYDLSTQRQLFLIEYQKIRFLCAIRTLLQKFQFQDPIFNLSTSQILKQVQTLKQTYQSRKEEASPRQNQLLEIVNYCQLVIQNTFREYDYLLMDRIHQAIRSSPSLNDVEEEAIRVIRDFEGCLAYEDLISNYQAIGTNNFWLTKSKLSSKGVGITLHNDLNSILKHQNRLVQKYIEKPLILDAGPLNSRKFDLRVWVLVVGNAPQIYYHQKFYGRICFDEYSLNPADIKQESIHLTNYSLNKKDFRKSRQLAESIIMPETLFRAVKDFYHFDYRTKFYQDFERILNKLTVVFRKEIATKQTANCLELFGFDVLIDASLHMHLLQVNLSAACEQRHPNLTQMLEQMAHGIINILENQQEHPPQLHGWKRLQ